MYMGVDGHDVLSGVQTIWPESLLRSIAVLICTASSEARSVFNPFFSAK